MKTSRWTIGVIVAEAVLIAGLLMIVSRLNGQMNDLTRRMDEIDRVLPEGTPAESLAAVLSPEKRREREARERAAAGRTRGGGPAADGANAVPTAEEGEEGVVAGEVEEAKKSPAGYGAAPDGKEEAEASSPGGLRDLVRREITRKVAEIELREKLQGDEWNPRNLDDLAVSLELSPGQSDQMVRVMDRAKEEIFNMVLLPTPDGPSILDDVVDAMADPENAEERTRQALRRLFVEKVPGRNQTYINEILDVYMRTKDRMGQHLGEDQKILFDVLNVDVIQFDTGYDPFGDYARTRTGQ
ncbi:MAG: hypothetical protein ACYTAF_12705 [Planctomycetota bacterium]|jgi:hypothetical protein